MCCCCNAFLQEKAAVSEILSKTSARAQTNFSLASKLAEKIGQQQSELMTLLGGPDGAASSSSSSTPSSSRSATPQTSNSVYIRSSSVDNTASTSYGSSTSTSSSRYEAPWEKSLAEARARIRQAEEEAAAAAAGARNSVSWAVRGNTETLEVSDTWQH